MSEDASDAKKSVEEIWNKAKKTIQLTVDNAQSEIDLLNAKINNSKHTLEADESVLHEQKQTLEKLNEIIAILDNPDQTIN